MLASSFVGIFFKVIHRKKPFNMISMVILTELIFLFTAGDINVGLPRRIIVEIPVLMVTVLGN